MSSEVEEGQGSLWPVLAISCAGLMVLIVAGGVAFYVFQLRALRRDAESLQRLVAEASLQSVVLAPRGEASSEELEATAAALRGRLDAAGLGQLGSVDVRADGRLVVQLPPEDSARARPLLLTRGDLRFELVSPLAGAELERALAAAATRADDPHAPHQVAVTPEGEVVLLEAPGVSGTTLSEVVAEGRQVTLRFDDAGAERLSELTRAAKGRQLAIVLDGVVLQIATLRSPLRDAAFLEFGSSTSRAERDELLLRLHAGRFPLELDLEVEVEEPDAAASGADERGADEIEHREAGD